MSMDTVSPLRQRMIEDMNARRLGAGREVARDNQGETAATIWMRMRRGRTDEARA
jgi:hypothetical protein